jgi:hypothetical protein
MTLQIIILYKTNNISIDVLKLTPLVLHRHSHEESPRPSSHPRPRRLRSSKELIKPVLVTGIFVPSS